MGGERITDNPENDPKETITQSEKWDHWNTHVFAETIWNYSFYAPLPHWEEVPKRYDLISRSGNRYVGRPIHSSYFDAGTSPGWKIAKSPLHDIEWLHEDSVLAWKLQE